MLYFYYSYTENNTEESFNNIESKELSCNCYVYSNRTIFFIVFKKNIKDLKLK